jgi:phosphoribosylaminoimidazole-succinocarboxamide synthase
MDRGPLLYDGKAKSVFGCRAEETAVILHFKDDATAFNGVKHELIEGKGELNCGFTVALFEVADEVGVAHHMRRRLSKTDLLCERVTIIPVEVVVRNTVAGSFAKRYGLEEGAPLSKPLIELFYKSDALDDPLLVEDAAVELGWATREELAFLKDASLRLNEGLVAFWDQHGIDLIDIKFEFGRQGDRILLADEITPDGCRLWEQGTGRRFDKDVFRRDLADLAETYRALAQRLFGT